MSDFNLVMISAWHEQGGNVFHRHLDGHPELFVYPFESTMATNLSTNIIAGPNHVVPQRYAYPEFSSEISAEQAYHAMSDHELKPYMRSKQLSKFRDCGMKIDENHRIDNFRVELEALSLNRILNNNADSKKNTRKEYIEAFFKSTFNSWKNYPKTGKEKTYVGYIPPILFDADKFFSDFPNGKMIHIIRNPFSGYADTLKRPYPFSLEKYCQIWNFTQLQALTYSMKYKDKFFVVCYEDLISNKKEVMEGITKILNIEWSDSLLYPSFAGNKLDQVYPWGTIKDITAEANIATANELTNEQSISIFKETYSMLSLYDYFKRLNIQVG